MEWNLPNKITALRLLILPFFIASILLEKKTIAIMLFAGIILTDMLDGHIARRTKTETEFGKKFDRWTDIIVLTTSLFALGHIGNLKILPLIILASIAIIGGMLDNHQPNHSKNKGAELISKAFGAANYLTILLAVLQNQYAYLMLFISIVIGVVRILRQLNWSNEKSKNT